MVKQQLYSEAVTCATCGKEHAFDRVMGYGCLVLIDGRDCPNLVAGAWCDETCLNSWLDSPEAKALFPSM